VQLPNLTASIGAPGKRAWPHVSTVTRRWGFGGLAVAWYAVNTFALLGLPNFAVAFVLGLLVMLSVEPDLRLPRRGVVATGRNLVLVLVAVAVLAPVAAGMDLLRGTIPIESGHALLSTLAAICVALTRFAQTRELSRPPVLGRRELIISVTALVAFVRAYHAGELVLAVLVFAVLAPVVMAVRRVRLGAYAPRRLTRGKWALQAGNLWLFLALLGMTVGLTSMLFLWRIFTPDAHGLIAAALWTGVAATAVLAAFPRRRISVATNVLVALGSIFLVVQLAGVSTRPADSVVIGVPSSEEWQVASGGRGALVNNHWTIGVQRHAIDFVQLVDGKTYRGDRSRLENFHIFGDPLLAVADGRVTAAVDSYPDPPVGERTWREMTGNHVILDIGGGRYVLYAHLKQGSLRIHDGDHVQRGQVIGQVGDSGNSDEPHLHIQVQDKPSFDVEDRAISTYPILFEGATVADPGPGDTVGPA
jgi:hypothetical protein